MDECDHIAGCSKCRETRGLLVEALAMADKFAGWQGLGLNHHLTYEERRTLREMHARVRAAVGAEKRPEVE